MVVFNRLFAAFCMSLAIVTAEASQMSLSECKERAAKGDAEAMWQLGQRYENGDGIRKDNLKALSQYRKAAEKGHAEACGRLAELYETCDGERRERRTCRREGGVEATRIESRRN